jgi:hydroxyacylglutathione hydrolase
MMKTEIHRLSLGMCYCYLIKEEGLILVDAGFPNQEKKFLKELKSLSIEPGDISLILLTHGHYDHIGSANEIKRLTGGKVAVNHREKDWVERAFKMLPPSVGLLGKVWGVLIKMISSRMSFPGTPVDLVLEDEDFSLESYGIHGKVIYTPGHSSGSMSLVLDTGDAFVGDLVMNGLPMRIGYGMPIFAEDTERVKESWRLLLDNDAKWIYSAHGKPFQADKLQKLL